MSKKTVKLQYLRLPSFKSFTASGLIGGITPNGKIRMNFYEDLPQIPTNTLLTIDDEKGRIISDNSSFESEYNSIREVTHGITIDIDLARSMYSWLGDKIKEYDGGLEVKSKN